MIKKNRALGSRNTGGVHVWPAQGPLFYCRTSPLNLFPEEARKCLSKRGDGLSAKQMNLQTEPIQKRRAPDGLSRWERVGVWGRLREGAICPPSQGKEGRQHN